MADVKPIGCDKHDEDLGGLDDADEEGFVELIGQLTGGGGEKEKRQDEDARGLGDEDLAILAISFGQHIGDEEHQRIFEDIVVKGAKELRAE
jgi:hypothetical protein